MGALVDNSDILRQRTNAHICWIHHTGKDLAKGARGHSSLRAATDTEIEVSHEPASGARIIKVTKQRDLATGGTELAGKLVPVDLGVNGWGKPVTACVVEGADVPVKSFRPNGAVQKAILSILKSHNGSMIKKELRDAILDMGMGKSGFYNAIQTLIEANEVADGMTTYQLVHFVHS
jgi:hypothetical protein